MTKKIILALFFALLLVGCNSLASPTSSKSTIVSDDSQSKSPKPVDNSSNIPRLSTTLKDPIVRTFDQTEGVSKKIPILMYHHLLKKKENTFTNNGVVLNLENFQQQMDYLYTNKYTTINLTELEQWLLGNMELPKKSVCITFDDGYLSSYIYAYPILKKYNFKAAQFLITSYVKDNSVEFNPKTQQFLSWKNISETTDVFEYSNHTHNLHKTENNKGYLITKPLDYVKKDLIKNTELTGSHYLSYPYGHHNDDVLNLLPKIGIRMAVTVNNGSVKRGDSLLELNRYGIYPKTSISTFKSMVNCEW
ncbi:polysaccharide deacetylase family protein [Clostridium estertheticum]|uniref:polysaccharide deacetylase family protein n=1 Tax=Clostridium estertheticum TaxID=238834 RepID=UPI0013EE99D6|nr:polysaccharide deacetylase family protein [Clostridium estertheticum]MBZ9606431.1 polysaccharide deacetylase family protein [Clostridium estertheticum]